MPKVWYVAIIGRPNAGKSTLINALIGERVSAVSSRPQTTQRSIPGIYTDEEKGIQIIFLDTPGIHHDNREQFGSQKSGEIHTLINAQAFAGLRDADIILRLIDPTRPQWAEDERIDEALSYNNKPIIRIETKQDLEKWYLGKNIDYKIDSVNHTGFDELIGAIAEKLPEWEYLYETDQYTDQTMELRISEVIREQLFNALGEEIPYACYIEVWSIENGDNEFIVPSNKEFTPENFAPKNKKGKLPMLSVQAYINTETDSQKTILIGKWGKKIQDIGTASRIILEEIFGKKVFLALRVKVDKNWRKNQKTLERLFPKK
jgi:GTP-binding protein Era